MSFKLTPEQEYCTQWALDAAQGKGGQVLTIEAGAGASKTTTLKLMAEKDERRSIYLAFNKAIAEEAKDKFPSHVECRTTHSVAYREFGAPIQHKLQRPKGPYQNVLGTGAEIARYFKLPPFETMQRNVLPSGAVGLAVRDTVARFEASADFEMEEKHVSFTAASKLKDDTSFDKVAFRSLVLKYAKKLWEMRIDPKSNVLATHETYLKLFQLSKPILSGYAVLYCDEMQDSSDCVIDIIKRQTSQVVLVGDDCQSIYGFRGAVNAMKKFNGDRATLSKSFRFGTAIAEAARNILSLKQSETINLQGWDQVDSKVVDFLPEEEENNVICYLYRTNAALVADGVGFLAQGRKVQLEFDVKDFTNMLTSAIALAQNRMKDVKHEEIVPYEKWDEMVKEGEGSPSLSRLVKIINDGEADKVIDILSNYKKPNKPELILTTAHKSKGREFDIVVLANDYPSVYDRKGEWVGLTDQEVHLLYVAATRAKRILVRNSTLIHIESRIKMAKARAVREEQRVLNQILED